MKVMNGSNNSVSFGVPNTVHFIYFFIDWKRFDEVPTGIDLMISNNLL